LPIDDATEKLCEAQPAVCVCLRQLFACEMVFGVALLALGAVDDMPHYHRGKLTQYEIGPPSVLLSKSDEQRSRRAGLSCRQWRLVWSAPGAC